MKGVRKMKFKIDGKKALKIGSTVIGVAGLLIGNLVNKNDRDDMKNELKDEILKEISKSDK